MLLSQSGSYSFKVIWAGALVSLACYLPSFMYTVGMSYWPEVFGLSCLYIGAWALFMSGYVYSQKASPVFASLFLLLSPYYWESLGIGFHNPHIMFADTLWMVVPSAMTPWVVMTIAHYLISSKQISLFIILALLSWQATEELEKTIPYIDDVYVFPEGLGHEETQKRSIVSRRIYTNDHVYHTMLGINGVEGISMKRHLTPIVESGYYTKYHTRIINTQERSILLLICNDVLFSDIWEEIDKADKIVVTSHLDDLSYSPIYNTFEKRIKYLNKISHKPVLWVDQSFAVSSELKNRSIASLGLLS